MRFFLSSFVIFFSTFIFSHSIHAEDPLPSWNGTNTKRSILEFIKSVTDPKSSSFVKPNERIVTFDNDGTLWAEQPVYFQLYFAIDQIKKHSDKHAEWKNKQNQ